MYKNGERITEEDIVNGILTLLCEETVKGTALVGSYTATLDDAGYATRDQGLLIHTSDGSEFQVVVRRER